MKKIGILSLYYHSGNLGGQLQARALVSVVEDFGFQAEQVRLELGGQPQGKRSVIGTAKSILGGLSAGEKLKTCIRLIRRYPKMRRLRHEKGSEFLLGQERMVRFENRTPHSEEVFNTNCIFKAGKQYDALITGSDQVWNPAVHTEPVLELFGLTFAEGKRRISYAASMGGGRLNTQDGIIFRRILSGMTHISVREKTARELLQPFTSKKIAVTYDPVLLKNKGWWSERAKRDPRQAEPYVFGYFLSGEARNHSEVKRLAKHMRRPFWCVSYALGNYLTANGGQLFDVGPEEFLGWIQNADCILTDSFHGTAFSILFHRSFWVFRRHKAQDSGSMNSRIADLLAELGLTERLLEDGEYPTAEKLAQPIDWTGVERILEEKRAFSLNWLKEALMG